MVQCRARVTDPCAVRGQRAARRGRRMISVAVTHLHRLLIVIGTIVGAVTCRLKARRTPRLEAAGLVIGRSSLIMPDGIPRNFSTRPSVRSSYPSVTKFAIGIGGSYGRGVMVCRSGLAFDGPWGAPAMYALDGGSFGLQLGGQSTDLMAFL